MSENPSPNDGVIDAFGVPGYLGRPAGEIRRKCEPEGFEKAFWISKPSRESDLYVVFQTSIRAESGSYTFAIQSSGNFQLVIDSEIAIRGPVRFSSHLPEYYEEEIALSAGHHNIEIFAHGELLKTRTMAPLPNFVWCRISKAGVEILLTWQARELPEYVATGLRISALLGWVEWREIPATENQPWREIASVKGLLELTGPLTKSLLKIPKLRSFHPAEIASGRFRETFTGYKYDDLASQFLLCNLNPDPNDDHDGIWFRYDLKKIRIGYFSIDIECENPAEIKIAYAERLTPHGEVSPVVALSAGATRMIQHFDVLAGKTSIKPFQSMGAKFIEVRVTTSGAASLTNPQFIERDFLGQPQGYLSTPDPALNKIWQVGIETLRSSAEDALVDSIRERAEWVGDVVTSALHILVAGWGDYTLVKRALLHAAASAREDGLVAGSGPGELIYLGTYASMWTTACLQIAIEEGDTALLFELEESARANIKGLSDLIKEDGSHDLPWSFVDWGYSPTADTPDHAVISHFIGAVASWVKWLELIGKSDEAQMWKQKYDHFSSLIKRGLGADLRKYHAYTLAAFNGIIPPIEASPIITKSIRAGFPYNRNAKRLRDPLKFVEGVITPYFSNYSMSVLINAGHGKEAIEFWLTNWGWMLEKGATTWWEVFDNRWSHCHYWSGAPTWQLSRFGLGLHPQLNLEGSSVGLRVNDFGLPTMKGRIHIPIAEWVDVQWSHLNADEIEYKLECSKEFTIIVNGEKTLLTPGVHRFTLVRILETDIFT
jgi:alpha-L-rhamnosidase